jgi:ferredoxin-NADP reductase
MKTTTLSVRVDAVHDEASDIRSFSISLIDGLPFDRYEPGARIDVTSPARVTREYSLCGDPARHDVHTFAVKRETQSRGGSRSLHDDVKVGNELTIAAPRNLFQLCPDASDHGQAVLLVTSPVALAPGNADGSADTVFSAAAIAALWLERVIFSIAVMLRRSIPWWLPRLVSFANY